MAYGNHRALHQETLPLSRIIPYSEEHFKENRSRDDAAERLPQHTLCHVGRSRRDLVPDAWVDEGDPSTSLGMTLSRQSRPTSSRGDRRAVGPVCRTGPSVARSKDLRPEVPLGKRQLLGARQHGGMDMGACHAGAGSLRLSLTHHDQTATRTGPHPASRNAAGPACPQAPQRPPRPASARTR